MISIENIREAAMNYDFCTIDEMYQSDPEAFRKCLDVMVKDTNDVTRKQVVIIASAYELDKYLDILINDEDMFIRNSLARIAPIKYLKILLNDSRSLVRETASSTLKRRTE